MDPGPTTIVRPATTLLVVNFSAQSAPTSSNIASFFLSLFTVYSCVQCVCVCVCVCDVWKIKFIFLQKNFDFYYSGGN